MNRKNGYTKEEAIQVVRDLVAVVEKRMGSCAIPKDFISEHPWTVKYLGRFDEAEELRKKVRTGAASIVDLTKSQQKIYTKETLVLFIAAPIGREILFRFERQDDGSYVALNG